MAIQPMQPQSIGGVLDTTFQLYKASVAKVWPLTLIVAIGSVLPYVYLFFKGSAGAMDPMVMATAMFSPGYWLMLLFTILLSTLAMGAIYIQQHSIATDAPMVSGAALSAALGRLLPMFFASILFGIALMIGLILLIVPGLILMVSLLLGSLLVVVEGKGPIDALLNSHRLVWGHWWRTFVILSVAFVVVIILYVAVGFIIGLFLPAMTAADTADLMVYSQITGAILGAVLNIILMPFFCAMLLSIYYDLKLRKEGGDLASRVGALNAA